MGIEIWSQAAWVGITALPSLAVILLVCLSFLIYEMGVILIPATFRVW